MVDSTALSTSTLQNQKSFKWSFLVILHTKTKPCNNTVTFIYNKHTLIHHKQFSCWSIFASSQLSVPFFCFLKSWIRLSKVWCKMGFVLEKLNGDSSRKIKSMISLFHDLKETHLTITFKDIKGQAVTSLPHVYIVVQLTCLANTVTT